MKTQAMHPDNQRLFVIGNRLLSVHTVLSKWENRQSVEVNIKGQAKTVARAQVKVPVRKSTCICHFVLFVGKQIFSQNLWHCHLAMLRFQATLGSWIHIAVVAQQSVTSKSTEIKLSVQGQGTNEKSAVTVALSSLPGKKSHIHCIT